MNNYIIKTIAFLVLFFAASFLGYPGNNKRSVRQNGQPPVFRSTDENEEDEEDGPKFKRWEFGINLGGYFANKYPANFYNGSEQNENKISYVMTNKYWYLDIFHSLNATDTIIVSGLPSNMHYKPAIMGGLFFRCNITKMHSLLLQGNYTQLKTEDAITLEVDPKPYLGYQDLRNYPIVGVEQRVMIDLAYQFTYTFKSHITLFGQLGPSLIYNRVMKNAIIIEGQEYSLINVYGDQNYVPNTPLQEYQNLQGGFGYGLYTGLGAGFPLTDVFAVEAGGYMHCTTIHLEGYPDLKPSFGIYLRFLLHNVI